MGNKVMFPFFFMRDLYDEWHKWKRFDNRIYRPLWFQFRSPPGNSVSALGGWGGWSWLVWGQLWLLCASHKHQGPLIFWQKHTMGDWLLSILRNFAEFEGEPLLDRHRNTHVFWWFISLHEMIQYIQGMTLDEKVPNIYQNLPQLVHFSLWFR